MERAHLIGFIGKLILYEFCFYEVGICNYQKPLDDVPNTPWLVQHTHPRLAGSLVLQIYLKIVQLRWQLNKINSDILLNLDS